MEDPEKAVKSFRKDLQNLDFDQAIGMPMRAVMTAQTESAKLTAEFIKEYGIERSTGGYGGQLAMMVMEYDKLDENGMKQRTKISVPFLAILPVPCLRITRASVEFNFKLDTIQKKASSFGMKISGSVDVEASFDMADVKVGGSFSLSYKTGRGESTKRLYDLGIKCDFEVPKNLPGLDKLMEMLKGAVSTRFEDESNKIVEANRPPEEQENN